MVLGQFSDICMCNSKPRQAISKNNSGFESQKGLGIENTLHHYMYMNPGRFTPITCSPRKVSRFAPLNRYYIIDEVFYDNFLLIIYLLVVCKKKIIHSFWSTFVKDLKRNFSCKIDKKPHKNSKKFFFVPTQKYMKWLRCCTSVQIIISFFNELRIKC